MIDELASEESQSSAIIPKFKETVLTLIDVMSTTLKLKDQPVASLTIELFTACKTAKTSWWIHYSKSFFIEPEDTMTSCLRP